MKQDYFWEKTVGYSHNCIEVLESLTESETCGSIVFASVALLHLYSRKLALAIERNKMEQRF